MTKSPEHTSVEGDLCVPFGRDEFGSDVVLDVQKLPHLLMSGMTGTGKSTLIHNILNSLLLKNSPERLRLILIDFKRVELPLYDTIPHLLTQVILEPKKAILALKWLNKEVDRRHSVLKDAGTTNIETYHKQVHGAVPKEGEEPQEQMPYILCVMDEFSDAMASYPRETEKEIVRLTQMSRVVGIHLILSTSRPSIKVITAAMKANIPARGIFQVASPVDSRWVLGINGAETPRNVGCVLFKKSGMTFPTDIQVPFISEDEIKKNIKEITNKYGSASFEAFQTTSDDDSSDDLYPEAVTIATEAGKASTSYLQRKMGIGYARAAHLMDMLEEGGVIEPADGAKPREVIKKPKS